MLIILHFSLEATQSAHHSTHTPSTHTVWYTGALSLLRHTPVPRRVMRLPSHLFSGEPFWAGRQGNAALLWVDTPTLTHLPPNIASSPLAAFGSIRFLKILICVCFTTCRHVFVFLLLLVHVLFLFSEAELVQDFHSWLADLKAELKECSNQSGDVAVLGTKLQRLKVQLHNLLLYISLVKLLW